MYYNCFRNNSYVEWVLELKQITCNEKFDERDSNGDILKASFSRSSD